MSREGESFAAGIYAALSVLLALVWLKDGFEKFVLTRIFRRAS